MFNRLQAYAEIGERAAKAVNENDAARAQSEREYFQRMFLCESPGPDRIAARKAFDDAYRSKRNVPKVRGLGE